MEKNYDNDPNMRLNNGKKGGPRKNTGGARAGAGRKKGSQQEMNITTLLANLKIKSGGKSYEDILIEDFLSVRAQNDKGLVAKYHHLILNKVMHSLAEVTVVDSADNIESKKLAFAEALAKITGINKDK